MGPLTGFSPALEHKALLQLGELPSRDDADLLVRGEIRWSGDGRQWEGRERWREAELVR